MRTESGWEPGLYLTSVCMCCLQGVTFVLVDTSASVQIAYEDALLMVIFLHFFGYIYIWQRRTLMAQGLSVQGRTKEACDTISCSVIFIFAEGSAVERIYWMLNPYLH